MPGFRQVPGLARRLMTMQTQRLNGATRVVASETPDAAFVPLPPWNTAEFHGDEQVCWKSMHKSTARVLAPAVLEMLQQPAR